MFFACTYCSNFFFIVILPEFGLWLHFLHRICINAKLVSRNQQIGYPNVIHWFALHNYVIKYFFLPAHMVQTSFLLCFCPGLDCGCTFRVVSLQTPNRGPRRVNKQAIQTPCFACYLSIMLVNQIYLPSHITQTLFLLCFCQSLDCGCTLCWASLHASK